MRHALIRLFAEDHRPIEKQSCKGRDSNERSKYQNVSFSFSSAASPHSIETAKRSSRYEATPRLCAGLTVPRGNHMICDAASRRRCTLSSPSERSSPAPVTETRRGRLSPVGRRVELGLADHFALQLAAALCSVTCSVPDGTIIRQPKTPLTTEPLAICSCEHEPVSRPKTLAAPYPCTATQATQTSPAT